MFGEEPFAGDTICRLIRLLTRHDKLLVAIRNNPKAVRFADACKIAESPSFRHKGGQGSHRAFGRADEPELLNFQNRGGYISPYQARQLIKMMDKHGEPDEKVSD